MKQVLPGGNSDASNTVGIPGNPTLVYVSVYRGSTTVKRCQVQSVEGTAFVTVTRAPV